MARLTLVAAAAALTVAGWRHYMGLRARALTPEQMAVLQGNVVPVNPGSQAVFEAMRAHIQGDPSA